VVFHEAQVVRVETTTSAIRKVKELGR